MTNQELRIAVAEADGWYHDDDGYWTHDDFEYRHSCSRTASGCCPNYPEDLTAIHAAVNRKNGGFKQSFHIAIKTQFTHKQISDITAKDWCEVFIEVSKTLKDK